MDQIGLREEVFRISPGVLESHFASLGQHVFAHTGPACKGSVRLRAAGVDHARPFMPQYLRVAAAAAARDHLHVRGAHTAGPGAYADLAGGRFGQGTFL